MIILLTSCHPILSAPCLLNIPNNQAMPAEIKEKTKIMWHEDEPDTSVERPKLVIQQLEKLGWTCWGRSGNNVCRMWLLSKGQVKGALNTPAPRDDWFKAPEDCPEDDVDWAPAEMKQIVDKRNYLLQMQKRAQSMLKAPKPPGSKKASASKQNGDVVVKTEPKGNNASKKPSQKRLGKRKVAIKKEKDAAPPEKVEAPKKKKGRKYVYVDKIKALSQSNNSANCPEIVKQPEAGVESSKFKKILYTERIKVLHLANKKDSNQSSDGSAKEGDLSSTASSSVQFKTGLVAKSCKANDLFQMISSLPAECSLKAKAPSQKQRASLDFLKVPVKTTRPKVQKNKSQNPTLNFVSKGPLKSPVKIFLSPVKAGMRDPSVSSTKPNAIQQSSASTSLPKSPSTTVSQICKNQTKKATKRRMTYADKTEALKAKIPANNYTVGSPSAIKVVKLEPDSENPQAKCADGTLPAVKQEPSNYYGFNPMLFSGISPNSIKVENKCPASFTFPCSQTLNSPPARRGSSVSSSSPRVHMANPVTRRPSASKPSPSSHNSNPSVHVRSPPTTSSNQNTPRRKKRTEMERRNARNPEFREPGAFVPDWKKLEPYTSMRIEQEGIAFAKERRGSVGRSKVSYVEISDDEEEDDEEEMYEYNGAVKQEK